MLWKRAGRRWRIGEGIGAARPSGTDSWYIATRAGGEWGFQGRLVVVYKVEGRHSRRGNFDLDSDRKPNRRRHLEPARQRAARWRRSRGPRMRSGPRRRGRSTCRSGNSRPRLSEGHAQRADNPVHESRGVASGTPRSGALNMDLPAARPATTSTGMQTIVFAVSTLGGRKPAGNVRQGRGILQLVDRATGQGRSSTCPSPLC
jgi:hypothetical protein